MSVATTRSSRAKPPGEFLDNLRGSLRYQDLRELGDRRGVALTWRSGWSENLSVILAMTADDDAETMAKTRVRRSGGAGGPWRLGNAGDEARGRPWTQFNADRALTMLCPGPEAGDDLISLSLREHADAGSLPPGALAEARAGFRAMARAFFRSADIPEGMRALLETAMDFGVTEGVHTDIASLWRECGRRPWDVEILGVTHPLVAVAALRDEGFRSVVRHGGTCEEALAMAWSGLTRGHMRRLRGVPVPKGDQGFMTPAMILGLCEAVPADWLPGNGDWFAFNSVSAIREGLNATVLREGGSRLFASAGGDWDAFRSRLKVGVKKGSWPSEDVWTRAIARDVRSLGDAPWQAATTLVQPLLSHEGVRRGLVSEALAGSGFSLEAFGVAYGLVYGDKSLPGVMEASRDWHKRQAGIQAAIAGIGDDISWPALFEPFSHLGMVAVPITDALALREEGAAGPDRNGVFGMDHCVATRLPLLLAGTSHVVSIRRALPDGGYERLSTLEVSVARREWREVEHQARKNFLPGVDAQVMAFNLRDAFVEGRLRVDRECLRPREGYQIGDVVLRMAGYDWRSARHVEGALRAWDPSLPRWMRGLTPAQAYDALAARGLLGPDWVGSMAVQDENGIRLAFEGGP